MKRQKAITATTMASTAQWPGLGQKTGNANSLLQQLRVAIKAEINALECATHPEICNLRGGNYPELERMVLNELLSGDIEAAVSVQTALANLEVELSHE